MKEKRVMKKHSEGRQQLSVVSGNYVDEELIQKRAYELYQERGMEDGHDVEDWLRAEEEVTTRETQSAAA
jgi:hypothetical protein